MWVEHTLQISEHQTYISCVLNTQYQHTLWFLYFLRVCRHTHNLWPRSLCMPRSGGIQWIKCMHVCLQNRSWYECCSWWVLPSAFRDSSPNVQDTTTSLLQCECVYCCCHQCVNYIMWPAMRKCARSWRTAICSRELWTFYTYFRIFCLFCTNV